MRTAHISIDRKEYKGSARADLSLRWAHIHFVGFVMRRLIYLLIRKSMKDLYNIVSFRTANASRSFSYSNQNFESHVNVVERKQRSNIMVKVLDIVCKEVVKDTFSGASASKDTLFLCPQAITSVNNGILG